MAKQDQARQQAQRPRRGSSRRRYALYGAAGVGLLAVAGAGYFIYREKSVEKPKHRVRRGATAQFEVREYPELLVAETAVAGRPRLCARPGLRQLADYIFAKSRDGEKVAMTAPVLSSGGGRRQLDDPLRHARRTSPATLCRSRTTGIAHHHHSGAQGGGAPVRRQRRRGDARARARRSSRAGSAPRSSTRAGEPERAFYNSPFMPGPLRRTEILIPLA